MTTHRPRFFLNPRCFALPLLALGVIAALAVAEGTESRAERAGACGPAIAIQDPGLRASFARFDRNQSAAAQKVCATYREWH